MHSILRFCLLFACCLGPLHAGEGKVRVFVLAGQSNMQGKGFPEPLAWQLSQAQYVERYRALVKDGDVDAFNGAYTTSMILDPDNPEYRWSVREDVWVDFLGRRGGLSVGFGVPAKAFGPELGFGHVLGNALEDPVLIIKTAWGGKSLGFDFLSPSAEQPSEKQLSRVRQPAEGLGQSYREMVEAVRSSLAELDQRFPALAGRTPELAGFVWFQGWNDQFNNDWGKAYGDNLAALVQDLQRDLEAPEMPVVIGQVGFDGSNAPHEKDGKLVNRTRIQQAQAAMAQRPELQGRVAVVETAGFWDRDAHAIYQGPGGWKEDVEAWRHFGNDHPYHYYGSPWFFLQAGTAFGEAMLPLLKDR